MRVKWNLASCRPSKGWRIQLKKNLAQIIGALRVGLHRWDKTFDPKAFLIVSSCFFLCFQSFAILSQSWLQRSPCIIKQMSFQIQTLDCRSKSKCVSRNEISSFLILTKCGCIIPATSCKCQRNFSVIRRLPSLLKATMTMNLAEWAMWFSWKSTAIILYTTIGLWRSSCSSLHAESYQRS